MVGRTSRLRSGHTCVVRSIATYSPVYRQLLLVRAPRVGDVSCLDWWCLVVQDLAGFPKGGSYWFRSQWLYSIPDTSPDKTFNTDGLDDGRDHMVHIVEGWDDDVPITILPTNKTFAEPCFDNSTGIGAETQQMTFLSNGDGSGTIKNSAGLCVDPSACPTEKVAHGGKGCFPLKFLPCKQSMSFTMDKNGEPSFGNAVAQQRDVTAVRYTLNNYCYGQVSSRPLPMVAI